MLNANKVWHNIGLQRRRINISMPCLTHQGHYEINQMFSIHQNNVTDEFNKTPSTYICSILRLNKHNFADSVSVNGLRK